MGLLKNLKKFLKGHNMIALFGLLVLVLALGQLSARKSAVGEGMGTQRRRYSYGNSALAKDVTQAADAAAVRAANPAGQNEVYASTTGISTATPGLPPSCSSGRITKPSELLPRDQNNEWAKLNPSGNADLNNVNMLSSGFHAGIDTIGSTLRNANLQVRSEPPNPTTKVSPWMQTTIEPDLMRVPLEIGCGPQ